MSTLFTAVQITSTNFDRILNDTFIGATAVRDRIQDLSIFALLHYAGTPNAATAGDTSKLTAIKTKMTATKGLNHSQWIEWVYSVAEVGVSKSGAFNKTGKGEVSPIALDTKWYEHGKSKETQKIDLNKAATKIVAAFEGEDLTACKVDISALKASLEKALMLVNAHIAKESSSVRIAAATSAAEARKEEIAEARKEEIVGAAKKPTKRAAKKPTDAGKIELPAVPELKAA